MQLINALVIGQNTRKNNFIYKRHMQFLTLAPSLKEGKLIPLIRPSRVPVTTSIKRQLRLQ